MNTEWISCKDSLPQAGKYVLITDDENMWIAFLRPDGRWDDGDFRSDLEATHWQDLPVPPGLLGDKA
ncbi:DUF551 domain-containing protein [Cronobacter phage vB_CsaM_GAP31]|uniref:DUF551 domain-containing protein n=1 Tax=Cronobacter phage vB_CsaM_GAP31 TaxID=1141135 RepID=K4F9C4_9CAUD|nr:DUF551 domain-containing protein [Cronobacter phage vB_CsaM_GAP31]AFC21435.1 hypothetical protein GAP31_254 [Cronobacter phage vB_CsaM_GAP31]